MAIIYGSPEIVFSNQILLILEQMNKCVCKVFFGGNGTSTGFFCFIPINNIKFPALITNNHVINEQFINKNETISLELNNEKKTINIKDKKIYTNREYDITIIEIDPDKDFIYNFLEIDENIFKEEEIFFKDQSIYLPQCDKKVSFGVLKKIDYDDQRIEHACSSDRDSGGSPIMNLSNGKVIGIHCGHQMHKNINIGSFIKKPIIEFSVQFKDYINKKINSKTYSIGKDLNNSKNESKNLDFENKNNINVNELELEREKNRNLKEKINQLQNLLNNNSNQNLNFDAVNSNELVKAVLKKDKEIEELKLKLSRFPFELDSGEKLISIIFASTDQKVLYSTICKNTDKFGNIELKLYDAYPDYSESVNIFTVNGNKINRSKNLDENKIKNHDTIILTAKG